MNGCPSDDSQHHDVAGAAIPSIYSFNFSDLKISPLWTAGSNDKLQACKKLGADVGINYKTEDWVARVKEETCGRGADVILDVMGASYLSKNTESLAVDGRLIVLGLQGGTVRSFGSNKNLRIQ